MSAWASIVIEWVPALLKAMPHIIKVLYGLSDLWSEVTKTKTEDDKVLKALMLLKEHQDDIDKYIENPERRKVIMEGLVILMTKIQNVERSQMSHESRKQKGSGHHEIQKYNLCCDVCTESFNTTERRPMLMPMCGHTLCKFCLREIGRRSCFRCPTCRKTADRPEEDFPTNVALLRLLSTEDDFTHCEKGKSELLTSSLTLSYEEQIEYALFLSRQDMDLKKEKNPTYSLYQQEEQEEDCFLNPTEQEKQEQESILLALSLQESETLWAEHSYKNQDLSRSQSCHEKTAPVRPDCLNDKVMTELDQGDSDHGYTTNASLQENAEEDSLQLAIRLQEEEMRRTENFRRDQELMGSQSCQGQTSQENAEGDSLQLAISLQEKEIQWADNFHRDQELMGLQSCQEQTSTPKVNWQSKEEIKRRKVKEQEYYALAIALSLSLQDEPNREQAGDSDSQEADFTE